MSQIVSGERFNVTYKIRASSMDEAKKRAFSVQVEQTVEFPYDLLPSNWFKDNVVGRLIALEKKDENFYLAKISYAVETTALEVTQFINVVFGNSSMQKGIWVHKIELSKSLWDVFNGPSWGIDGIRKYLNVPKRAMLQAVIKPMGSSIEQLAKMCKSYALAGVDVIKDDHGITNQIWSPYEERIKRCVEAVQEGNIINNTKTLFAANVTGDGTQTIERAYQAKELGATALMVAPVMAGFGTMHQLATDKNLNMPIISHPALSGGNILDGDSGFEFAQWFGFLNRLFGSDMSIFVSYGGRFSFTKEMCQGVMYESLSDNYPIKKACPAPGGGVTEARLPELMNIYGQDVMYLVGGDMFRRSNDIETNAKHFINILEEASLK